MSSIDAIANVVYDKKNKTLTFIDNDGDKVVIKDTNNDGKFTKKDVISVFDEKGKAVKNNDATLSDDAKKAIKVFTNKSSSQLERTMGIFEKSEASSSSGKETLGDLMGGDSEDLANTGIGKLKNRVTKYDNNLRMANYKTSMALQMRNYQNQMNYMQSQMYMMQNMMNPMSGMGQMFNNWGFNTAAALSPSPFANLGNMFGGWMGNLFGFNNGSAFSNPMLQGMPFGQPFMPMNGRISFGGLIRENKLLAKEGESINAELKKHDLSVADLFDSDITGIKTEIIDDSETPAPKETDNSKTNQQTVVNTDNSKTNQQTVVNTDNSNTTQQTVVNTDNSNTTQQTVVNTDNSKTNQQTVVNANKPNTNQQTVVNTDNSKTNQQTKENKAQTVNANNNTDAGELSDSQTKWVALQMKTEKANTLLKDMKDARWGGNDENLHKYLKGLNDDDFKLLFTIEDRKVRNEILDQFTGNSMNSISLGYAYARLKSIGIANSKDKIADSLKSQYKDVNSWSIEQCKAIAKQYSVIVDCTDTSNGGKICSFKNKDENAYLIEEALK